MTHSIYLFNILLAGPGSSVKTPEVSSTLSAISKKTLPTETVARTTVAAFPSTVSNAGGVHIYDNLPARYRRRPLTDEEIEYIEVCGLNICIGTLKNAGMKGMKFPVLWLSSVSVWVCGYGRSGHHLNSCQNFNLLKPEK